MTSAILSAVYLGILCAISPCPLAANIAAISFSSRKTGDNKAVLYAGLLYTLGRVITFCFLGFLLSKAADLAPEIFHVLQKYMNMFLGPLLILAAMFMLGLLKFPAGKGIEFRGSFLKHLEKYGVFSSILLGIILALSFCPSSAVLFFGTLMPLAVKVNSPLLLSGVFGAASGIPVLIFAFVIAFFSSRLAKIFNFTGCLERWTTKITGLLFLFIGIYFTISRLTA